MDQGAVVDFNAFWQIGKKLAMFFSKLLRRPFSRNAGSFAEILQVNLSNRRPIMISCNNDIGTFTIV